MINLLLRVSMKISVSHEEMAVRAVTYLGVGEYGGPPGPVKSMIFRDLFRPRWELSHTL